jgi:hypothetical protein
VIHRQALAFKPTSPELEKVLEVNIHVNYNKTIPLKARIFVRFWEDMCAEHSSLICTLNQDDIGGMFHECSN